MTVASGFRMLQIHDDCSDAPFVPAADRGQVRRYETGSGENSIILRAGGLLSDFDDPQTLPSTHILPSLATSLAAETWAVPISISSRPLSCPQRTFRQQSFCPFRIAVCCFKERTANGVTPCKQPAPSCRSYVKVCVWQRPVSVSAGPTTEPARSSTTGSSRQNLPHQLTATNEVV